MQKICIVGGSGSGKSTLARELGRVIGLPVIHLDQHYWSKGWQARSLDEEWRAIHRRLIEGDRWIVDGCYSSTLAERIEACDTIIHLDLARWRCVFRVLKRTATSHGQVRPDLAEGCPERFDSEFLHYVWSFNETHRPRILRAVESWRGRRNVITLRSPRQVRRWLASIEHPVSETSGQWRTAGENAGA
jgi:adenylate kinase family enzyme